MSSFALHADPDLMPSGPTEIPGVASRRLSVVVAAVAGLICVAVVTKPSLAALLVVACVVILSVFIEPTHLLGLGVGLTAFAGFWDRLGVPLPLHRVTLLGAVVGMAVGFPLGSRRAFRTRWRAEHLMIVLTVMWVVHSATTANTLHTPSGQTGLFDRLGINPFLLFLLTPLIVDSEAKRRIILRWLVVFGVYFAITAMMEGLGLKGSVWPKYISDASVGIHVERARGPFVEATADGLALFFSAIAGVLLARRSRGLERSIALMTAIICLLSTVFTLTRSVWIGVVLALGVMMASSRALRRLLVPAAISGVLVVAALLAFVPGLRSSADERAGSQRSIWDRQNLNTAAIAAVKDKPLTGVGWSNFVRSAPNYLWQAEDYPLSGQGIDIHNFVLRILAEVGIVGFLLWATTLMLCIGGSIVRRGPPALADWRWGLVGMFVMWGVVASLTPGEFAHPTFVLWMWAGIAHSEYLRTPRVLTNTLIVHPKPGLIDWDPVRSARTTARLLSTDVHEQRSSKQSIAHQLSDR